MQFENFHLLYHQGSGAIILCSTNAESGHVISWGFLFLLLLASFSILWGIYNKAVIPLALVSYPPCHIQHAIVQ